MGEEGGQGGLFAKAMLPACMPLAALCAQACVKGCRRVEENSCAHPCVQPVFCSVKCEHTSLIAGTLHPCLLSAACLQAAAVDAKLAGSRPGQVGAAAAKPGTVAAWVYGDGRADRWALWGGEGTFRQA